MEITAAMSASGQAPADVEKRGLISMQRMLIKEIVKNYGIGNSQKAGSTSALEL